MSEKRHILIYGEVGVGKSPPSRRLLAHTERPLCGFATKRDFKPNADGSYPVYIHPAAQNAADRFRSAVLRALDGDIPVLAAVKTRDTAFLREVRSHPNASLYMITPENRDRLYEQLLPRILA